MTLKTSLSSAERKFLFQLYQQTDGDQARQAHTAAIGAAIGVNKDESRKISEDLIGQGLVTVKTLSGGIGITSDGRAEVETLDTVGTSSRPVLGNVGVINTEGRQAVERILTDLKKAIEPLRLTYDVMEVLVIDLKTIEVQLLSPRPKTEIVKACVVSILAGLKGIKATNAMNLIQMLIGSPDEL